MQFVKPTPRCNVVKIYELKIKIHDAKQGTLYVTKYYKVIKGYIMDWVGSLSKFEDGM